MTLTLVRPGLENATGVSQPAPRAPRERRPEAPVLVDVVDRWGMDSFPASDPPANW